MKLLSKKENVSIVNLVNGRKQLRTTKIKIKTKYVVSVVTFVDDEVNWSENKFTKRHPTQNRCTKTKLIFFRITVQQIELVPIWGQPFKSFPHLPWSSAYILMLLLKLWIYKNHICKLRGEELYESRSIAVIDATFAVTKRKPGKKSLG